MTHVIMISQSTMLAMFYSSVAIVLRHRDTPKLLCTLYCIFRESKHGILNCITVKGTDDGFSLQGKSYHSMRKNNLHACISRILAMFYSSAYHCN